MWWVSQNKIKTFHFLTFPYLVILRIVCDLYFSFYFSIKVISSSTIHSHILRTQKSAQCILFTEICLAIAVSSLDFQSKGADSLVGNDTFEIFNQTDFRPDSVARFASVLPLNKTRQERIHVFRPLFVYRQEQLMKKRVQNKNPDRNTVNKNPKPAAPSQIHPAQNHYPYYNYTPAYFPFPPVVPASVPFYPYVTYPSHPYVNSLSQSYHYPSYHYPTYSPYPPSSYYSSQTAPTYYPNSYYTGWPSTANGYSNYDYYASKGYLDNEATSSNAWPSSSDASFYAPQTAAISYIYPTEW